MPMAAPKFEQPPQAEQPEKKLFAFDYEKANLLAQERIALEGASEAADKIKKAALKRQINQMYGKAEDETPMRQIFNWEIEKQRLKVANEIINDKLDKGKEFTERDKKELKLSPDTRNIEYFEKSGLFAKVNKKGEQVKASLADLITDINWDNYYEIDESVPIDLRKKYYEAYYQAKIDEYTDKQLSLQRVTLEINPIKSPGLVNIYNIIDKRKEIKQAGLLFERMINNLLIKISIDLPEWGLKMDRATVVEDVEETIDFLIEFEKDYRGVNVEESEKEAKDKPLGIQFTIRSEENDPGFRVKERRVAEKKKELKKVKDLILVSVPIEDREVKKKYRQWNQQDQMPGGPENLFEVEEVTYFIAQFLRDTEFVEEIDEIKKGIRLKKIVLKDKYRSDLIKYLESKK
jgi:hypothetical protein